MKKVFNDKYKALEDSIDDFVKSFDNNGKQLKDARNKLKVFKAKEIEINIKSFKVPNIINQIIYALFRKGKAQRSYEYARKLLSLDIDTPDPIAYYENKWFFLLKKSYYISEQLEYDLTYRELTTDFSYEDYENILRAFVRFTCKLHKKGVHFLDHSPGNTLIQKKPTGYKFYLVEPVVHFNAPS